jgi:hypothetical protein
MREIEIYREVPLSPDKLIGRIDDEAKVYDVTAEEKMIGWIDYEEGDVYDAENELLGWVESDGAIIRYMDEEEEDIGFVTEDGEVYGYDEGGDNLYLGRVKEMRDAVEGAVAMLLFFDWE